MKVCSNCGFAMMASPVNGRCMLQLLSAKSNYSAYAVISSQLSVRSFHNPHKNKMSATHPATGPL